MLTQHQNLIRDIISVI